MRWFVIGLLMLLFGCKKGDEIPPSITIVNPFAMSQFQIPFQINVTGNAQDENVIEWIKILVLNDALAPSSQEILIEVNESSVEFNEWLSVDNIHLNSGVYFVKVSASDGENIHSSYIEINVLEYPLILEDVYVINSNNNQTNLFKIDSNSLEFVNQFDGQFQLANAISKHQYLFIGTGQLGNAFDPNYNQNIWNWSFTTFLSTYFNDSEKSESGDVLHLCCSDGVVRSFTEIGTISNTVYSSSQEYFDDFLIVDNYLFVEAYSSLLVRYLIVYFLESGIEMQRISLINNIIDIVKYNSHQCLFLEQVQSDIEIKMYDRNSNLSWTLSTITNDSIHDAEYVLDRGLYFVSDVGLRFYNVENNVMNTLLVNDEFKKIKYDELNEQFYLLSNNEIWIYSLSTGQYQTLSTSISLKEILLFYNK